MPSVPTLLWAIVCSFSLVPGPNISLYPWRPPSHNRVSAGNLSFPPLPCLLFSGSTLTKMGLNQSYTEPPVLLFLFLFPMAGVKCLCKSQNNRFSGRHPPLFALVCRLASVTESGLCGWLPKHATMHFWHRGLLFVPFVSISSRFPPTLSATNYDQKLFASFPFLPLFFNPFFADWPPVTCKYLSNMAIFWLMTVCVPFAPLFSFSLLILRTVSTISIQSHQWYYHLSILHLCNVFSAVYRFSSSSFKKKTINKAHHTNKSFYSCWKQANRCLLAVLSLVNWLLTFSFCPKRITYLAIILLHIFSTLPKNIDFCSLVSWAKYRIECSECSLLLSKKNANFSAGCFLLFCLRSLFVLWFLHASTISLPLNPTHFSFGRFSSPILFCPKNHWVMRIDFWNSNCSRVASRL